MLIDTNIIIYAINADSPKNKTAQLFLKKQIKYLDISQQNIFEALRVLTHPKFSHPMTTRKARAALDEIIKVCNVICPNNKTHYIALELITKHKLYGNQIFDAYLVAMALGNGINKIATDNVKDFKKFSEIKIINPFEKN